MMAEEILEKTRDPRVAREARLIIESQSQQVEMFRKWLKEWYGLKPRRGAKKLIESDACVINHINDPLNDKHFLTETIEHHHISNEMSLLILQKIHCNEFPEKACKLRRVAKEILEEQYAQIKRFIKILKDRGYLNQ